MNTPETETPRTDDEILHTGHGNLVNGIPMVLASFARTLELEVNQLRGELETALEHQEVPFHTCSGEKCQNKYCRLRQDRDHFKSLAAENWKMAEELAIALRNHPSGRYVTGEETLSRFQTLKQQQPQ